MRPTTALVPPARALSLSLSHSLSPPLRVPHALSLGLCGAAGCVLDAGWTGGTSRDCRYVEQTPEGTTGGEAGDVIMTVCSAPPAGDYEKPSL